MPHEIRSDRSVLLIYCFAHFVLAYYFLFIEKDYPVAKLGSSHEPDLAVADSSIVSDKSFSVGAARSSFDPTDRLNEIEGLEKRIQSAGEYLCGQCTQTGQFVYKSNLISNIGHDKKYNVLRHAGTIYALTQFYRWHPSEETLATLRRSTEFLKANCIAPVPENPGLLAVWSSPKLTHGDHPLKAKLGGAGLALVALTSFEAIEPGSTPLDKLRRLGRFLLYMQKPDGSFYSKYIPSSGGRYDKWTSLYYPGEAALGLAMLYEIDPDQRWLNAAAGAISYLARSRQGKKRVEADHWALLATARILPKLEHGRGRLTKELALAHARQICKSILAEQQKSTRMGKAYGGFAADGRVCPTATRLEGLLAARSVLDDGDNALLPRLEIAIPMGINFLLEAQVNSGEHAGAVPRAISPLPRNHRHYSPAFNRRATEVRIDYVQHWLSALIEFHTHYLRTRHTAANDSASTKVAQDD